MRGLIFRTVIPKKMKNWKIIAFDNGKYFGKNLIS